MTPCLHRSSQLNRETTTLIWFDPEIENQHRLMTNLRIINDYVLIYTKLEECKSYIQSVKNEKIFLILPTTCATVILPSIINVKQLDRVFLFCKNSESNSYLKDKYSSKIAGVFTNQHELENSLQHNLGMSNKQVETFSFYDQNQKVSVDLSERTAEFLWTQLFHHAVRCLPSTKEAQQEMINICRQYYQGNEHELKVIKQFEKSYTKDDCIHWYTQETFVYKMVNKALRTGDIEQLYLFRFYVNDLSSELLSEFNKRNNDVETNNNNIVYRGTCLTQTDFEQFQSNEGKLIAINGYLSASRLKEIAEEFVLSAKRKDCVSVLFEIDCDDENNCAIFADIAKFSVHPREQEVLFDLGAVFKIESVRQDKHMSIIHLSSTSEGRDIAREYINEAKKDMPGNSEMIFFGFLLTRLGYYDKAETYFQHLIKDLGKENLAHVHNQLGLVLRAKAEFNRAMGHFYEAYSLMKKSGKRDMAYVLRNIGEIFIEQREFSKAIDYCNQAMSIFKELDETDYLNLAHCLQSIGSSYFGQQLFDEALEQYQESLNMKQICLPENHIYIAETLNSIGLVYFAMKSIERAFQYYLSSLEMYEKILPENHLELAHVLHNIADCFLKQNQIDKALRHYELALKIKQKSLHSEHPSIASTLNQMSTIFSLKDDKEKALELCLKALNIREQILSFNHPDLAVSYFNTGLRYESVKNYFLSLEYFEKALEIRSRILSRDDPLRKQTEKHILRLKQKL